VLRSFCLSLFWPLHCLCFDPFTFLYFGHCIVCASILLSFFILAIALSELRSFCLSLFWPLHCLCFDLFAFRYFGHCIVCASILCLSLFWPLYCLCFDLFAFFYFGHCIVCATTLLPFFILAIIFSVLRSFCFSLFWPLYCLCFDPFAFLYFGHCIVCASIPKLRKAKGSKNRQYNGQNKERQKDRSTDNTMAKIKKGKTFLLPFFILAIVSSVLRFTTSDYLFWYLRQTIKWKTKKDTVGAPLKSNI
jgi:hypothetical protein